MPLKTCPKCSTGCGPRSKKCKKCGYDFASTTTKPKGKRLTKKASYRLGLGAWINDKVNGMPNVEEPEPLSNLPKKLSIEDVADHCMYEGLPFCVFAYIPAKRIKDKKLAQLWDDAGKRLSEIAGYLIEKESE